eukprot:gene17954-32543_t
MFSSLKVKWILLIAIAASGITGTRASFGGLCDEDDDTANYGNGIGDFWYEDPNAQTSRAYCYGCNLQGISTLEPTVGCGCITNINSNHPYYNQPWDDLRYGSKGSIGSDYYGMSTETYNTYGCKKGFFGRHCLSCQWAKCRLEGSFIQHDTLDMVGQVTHGGYEQYKVGMGNHYYQSQDNFKGSTCTLDTTTCGPGEYYSPDYDLPRKYAGPAVCTKCENFDWQDATNHQIYKCKRKTKCGEGFGLVRGTNTPTNGGTCEKCPDGYYVDSRLIESYCTENTQYCGPGQYMEKLYTGSNTIYCKQCPSDLPPRAENQAAQHREMNCGCPVGQAGGQCEYSDAETCSGNGSVDDAGACTCNDGCAGVNCEFTDTETCNNNGACQDDGSCVCNNGSSGASCEFTDAETCTSNGASQDDGSCVCSASFVGPSCSIQCPELGMNGADCSFTDELTCNGRKALFDGTCLCSEKLIESTLSALNAETTAGADDSAHSLYSSVPRDSPDGRTGPTCEFSNAATCSARGIAMYDGSCICGDAAPIVDNNIAFLDTTFGASEFNEAAQKAAQNAARNVTTTATPSTEAQVEVDCSTVQGLNSHLLRACCNGNCVAIYNQNDDFDHCGDGSDEDGRCGFESSDSIFPWKAPVAKWILEKLGCLWCFEIDYPTDKDSEARQVEINTVLYRKAAGKCGCTATVFGCCTVDGPTVTTPDETVEPSTSLFDPMTKLYRWLGLPGTESGCGKWCSVHGPNPDESNNNILFAPGAAIMQNCCGDCCAEAVNKADETVSPATKNTSAFGFSNAAPIMSNTEEGSPGYIDVETTNP